jgi:hypothetical protein
MKVFKQALLAAKRNKKALAIAAMTTGASAFAADGVDSASIVTAIAAAGITIAVVGNAKLLMELGMKAFKWIRGAMS